MATRLSDAERALRTMTPAQLADEVGHVKGQVADCREHEERLKAEFVRRKLTEAAGELFRVTLSALAGERFSLSALREDKGESFVARYVRPITPGWVLRCSARRREPAG